MIRLIQKGPQPAETPTAETDGRPARPISAVGESLEQEKRE
ncbi:cyanide-insensitive oxidase CioA [Salmonella enterica subsp. enterica serovar Choleraesuis str. 0006]|nr:cyanide-insensitive oxidase CioA [Salmonella enterica subsp. enterica serovar Choleraesuis str. 0006]SUH04951.1 terminal oxidase subunit I [Salmonella enterica subsp. enterica]